MTAATMSWMIALTVMTNGAPDAATPPSAADRPAVTLAQLQEYVPDASRDPPPSSSGRHASPSPPKSSTGREPAAREPVGGDNARKPRGSGTPPDLLTTPVAPPRIVAPPSVPGSEDATARFKRDLLAPGVNAMERDRARGDLNINQQRDLMKRQQELHRLDVDPLRR